MKVPDVAILLDHFGSGGVERVACHVANGLSERGFRVEMVVLRDDGPTRALLSDGVSVQVVAGSGSERRGDRMRAAVPSIAAYLRERSPRLLHAPGNHLIRPATIAAVLGGFNGPLVVKITNPLLTERRTWWKRRMRKRSYRVALKPTGSCC